MEELVKVLLGVFGALLSGFVTYHFTRRVDERKQRYALEVEERKHDPLLCKIP